MTDLDDVELVEKSFFDVIREDIIYPKLYKPVDKLDVFLSENRDLFALIGVFGAVSLYFRTVQGELDVPEIIGRSALASGFSLVVILSSIILIKIGISMRNGPWFDNLGLIIFTAFFVPILFVLVGILLQFSQFWSAIYFMIVWAAIVLTAFGVIFITGKISNSISNYTEISPLIIGYPTLFVIWVTCSIMVGGEPLDPSVSGVVDGNGAVPLSDFVSFYKTGAIIFTLIYTGMIFIILTIVIALGLIISSILWAYGEVQKVL